TTNPPSWMWGTTPSWKKGCSSRWSRDSTCRGWGAFATPTPSSWSGAASSSSPTTPGTSRAFWWDPEDVGVKEEKPMAEVEKLGVLGAGVMGAAIAHTAALHGIPAACVDLEPSILERSRARLDHLMRDRIARGKMTEDEREAVWERLHFSVDFDALADATWIVEASVEDLAAKRDAFSRLDALN